MSLYLIVLSCCIWTAPADSNKKLPETTCTIYGLSLERKKKLVSLLVKHDNDAGEFSRQKIAANVRHQ